ncbi:MAG: hypothetical protein LBI61_01570 [Puniceicoccales bacterium]|jgi:hypothetical protein|nr:hypothetical protein [Puniceicoccales bacterium]
MPDVTPVGPTDALQGDLDYVSPLLVESYVQPVRTSATSVVLNLGSGTISNLFDISDSYGGKTMKQLMEEYPDMKMFIIAVLLVAKTEEATTENLIQSINMYRERQEGTRKDVINKKNIAQAKREELAYDEKEWKALAGTSPSGGPTEDKKLTWWQRIWHFVVAAIITLIPIIGLVLSIINLVSMIPGVNATMNRQMKEFLSYTNLASATADLVVGIVCEAGGFDENDKEMQKLKMGIMIAVAAIQIIVQIVIAIATVVGSFGTAAPLVIAQVIRAVMAIAEIITAAVDLAAAILQVVEGYKELEIAKEKYALDKLVAATEKLRLDLETISQEISIVVEMFSSKLEDVREEYEKASRILKDYNDAKLAVTRNFRA